MTCHRPRQHHPEQRINSHRDVNGPAAILLPEHPTPQNINDNSNINLVDCSQRFDRCRVVHVASAVNITHTYIGDLTVDLVAPNGTPSICGTFGRQCGQNIVRTFP